MRGKLKLACDKAPAQVEGERVGQRDRLNGGKGRDRATRNRGDRIRSIERVRTMRR